MGRGSEQRSICRTPSARLSFMRYPPLLRLLQGKWGRLTPSALLFGRLQALGFTMPQFGHVSLILAPDRSKLSKRHGATSVGQVRTPHGRQWTPPGTGLDGGRLAGGGDGVGQFKEMGYLPEAMVNYMALLGWNDGTEDEVFAVSTIGRGTGSIRTMWGPRFRV